MPYRIDFFAVFILLGVVQAFFLSSFFLAGANRRSQANFFHGLLLLSLALCIFEIFLMYTGYIRDCLFLVDFSEAPAFLIGPSLYLMVVALTRNVPRRYNWHLAFPCVYLLLQLPFLLQGEDVKYNAYIGAYHPDMPQRAVDLSYDPRLFWVTDHHTELVLISMLVYATLSTVEVVRAFRARKESFWRTTHPVLRSMRAGILQLIVASVSVVVVKLLNRDDTGDHFLAAYLSFSIYITSFRIIRDSAFFKQGTLAGPRKYKSSSLTEDAQNELLERLDTLMRTQKPYLNPDFSLPDLATLLKTSVHNLSQVINDGLGKNFFELLAGYRVEEAKRLLVEQAHIKIEDIAAQAGYNSKSSFHAAFKKITGKTPAAFRHERAQ